jgi:hypothetical protein
MVDSRELHIDSRLALSFIRASCWAGWAETVAHEPVVDADLT